jgi:hypothetical protein
VRRERRRAKAAPFPRPRGPSPQGCTWDEQKGGWWKADGTEWQRKRVAEPGAPKGPTKWTIAFEEECAAREAREKAVRFDSSTVYCAKHLYTLDNEMCSTCANRGWRDVRCARHLEPHANCNLRVPGASSTRTGLSRARTTSMAPSVVSTVSRGENRTYGVDGALPSWRNPTRHPTSPCGTMAAGDC